jgi:hypothetical protein
MFASSVQLGRLPWSYDQVWRMYQKAGAKAGIGRLGTHSLRHTYRSWLDAVGTPVAVQQKLMRHADIRTTMNIYGDVVTDEMAQAQKLAHYIAQNRSTNVVGTGCHSSTGGYAGEGLDDAHFLEGDAGTVRRSSPSSPRKQERSSSVQLHRANVPMLARSLRQDWRAM